MKIKEEINERVINGKDQQKEEMIFLKDKIYKPPARFINKKREKNY